MGRKSGGGREGRGEDVVADGGFSLRDGYEQEEDAVLLDLNALAEEFGYAGLNLCKVSPDHNHLAYTLDICGGGERFSLFVKDLCTGEVCRLHGCAMGMEWAADSQTLFFTACGGEEGEARGKEWSAGEGVEGSEVGNPLHPDRLMRCAVQETREARTSSSPVSAMRQNGRGGRGVGIQRDGGELVASRPAEQAHGMNGVRKGHGGSPEMVFHLPSAVGGVEQERSDAAASTAERGERPMVFEAQRASFAQQQPQQQQQQQQHQEQQHRPTAATDFLAMGSRANGLGAAGDETARGRSGCPDWQHLFMEVSRTKDWRFLTLNVNSRTSSQVHLIDGQHAAAPPHSLLHLVEPRAAGVEYYVEHHCGWLYAVTNVLASQPRCARGLGCGDDEEDQHRADKQRRPGQQASDCQGKGEVCGGEGDGQYCTGEYRLLRRRIADEQEGQNLSTLEVAPIGWDSWEDAIATLWPELLNAEQQLQLPLHLQHTWHSMQLKQHGQQ